MQDRPTRRVNRGLFSRRRTGGRRKRDRLDATVVENLLARSFVRTVPRLAPAALAAVLAGACLGGVEGTAEMERFLEDRGRVAVVGGDDLLRLGADGATLVRGAEIAGLEAALAGSDEDALSEVLSEAGVEALLVDGRGVASADIEPAAPLRDRLRAYDSFEVLQAVYLTPSAALYVPRTGLVLRAPHDFALAYVARGILGGARPPRMQSFPEPLRRIRNVEVMVMLKDGERPRLWRSARGSSIARALLTASIVARQRWSERASVMGGPLDAQLRAMDVEVYLLDEDGSLGSRAPAFVERAFSPEHGVAFDHLGTWRYLLPDATRERGQGSAVRAYDALFEDSDMEPGSISREDVRLYRLLARLLARSPAPAGSRLVPADSAPAAPTGGAVSPVPSGAESGADVEEAP